MNSIRPSNVWLLYFHFNFRNYFVCTNLMALNNKQHQSYHHSIISNWALITILMFFEIKFRHKIVIDNFEMVDIIELKWLQMFKIILNIIEINIVAFKQKEKKKRWNSVLANTKRIELVQIANQITFSNTIWKSFVMRITSSK